uniref:GW182 middle domain-containing protein n=1 Tax=Setaria digitata TaxID=48799 RepID=A0A915PRI4_9BILA
MWPGGSGGGVRSSNAAAAISTGTSSGANGNSSTGSGSGAVTGPQPSFSGVRVNDQRGNTGNQQRWLDHHQAQQWNAQAAQWGPHVAGGPSPPHPWPVAAAAQQWPGAPSSNSGTGVSTYAEHAKKNMIPRGGQGQIQGRYDQQHQQWNQVKVDQQTPWDTSSLAGFNSMHGGVDTKLSAAEWGSVGAPNTRWAPPATQWPVHAAATSSAASPDWATAAAVVAAAAAAHHRHDATSTPWTNATVAPHPVATALPPQVGGAWGQTPAVGQQAPASALPNLSEQYDPNPQTPGPWVAPQPQEMNNDMMWHDPNPKQKKVQRDTGTAIWGDPCQQPIEIKRWKDAEVDDYSHIQSAMPSGGDWNIIAISSNGSTVCTGVNGAISGGTGTGHATSSCCSATGTNVSTPTTTGNGPWPDGSHPEPSSSGQQERWQQQHTAAWSEKLDDVGDNHHPPNLVSGSTSVGGIGMHGLMDNALIRSDIGGSGMAGSAPYTSLTQQIADRIRIAVSKGLIDVSMLNRPLPQSALVVLNTLLQKFPKLEQAQQEYQQVMRAMSSPAQKVESERLAVEISGLQHEIIQLRNSMNEQLLKVRSNTLINGTLALPQQQDGQSRLQQWKQANTTSTQDCSTDKICGPSSDPNISSLIAGTQVMSLDEKIDWKAGSLDWSPPPAGAGDKAPDIIDKDDPACNSAEKQHQGASSSTNQSGNGTPTPQQSQTQAQAVPVDDGPQEFVPGKKWEWRDPNKVAEDPNATPGTCKPNPLLTTSSAAQPFYLYGNNTNSSSPQGNTATSASNAITTTANYLNDPQTINRSPSVGYLGWNGGNANPAAFTTSDMWPTTGTGSAAVRQSRVASGPTGIGPFGHAAIRSGPGGTAGPAAGPYQRSNLSPFGLQQQQHQWVFVQLHGVNEKQVQLLCQKVGQIVHAFCPHGAPFLCVKFIEPAEEIIRRLKAEAPFLQLKTLTESEMDRLLKPRTTLSYSGPLGPAGTGAEQWMFGAGTVTTLLPNCASTNTDILPQQPHFHAADTAADLTRPF